MDLTMKKGNPAITSTIVKVYAVLLSIAQVFSIYKLATGVAMFFGMPVTIKSSIELVFGIFYMSGAYYRGILGSIIGAVYIGFLIAMIINIINTIPLAKNLIANTSNDSEVLKKRIFLFGKNVGENYVFVIIFPFACALVKDFAISTDVYAVIAIWAAITLLTKALYSFVETNSWGYVLNVTLANLTVLFVPLLILFYAKTPAVEDIIYYLKNFIISPLDSFVSLISPIIYVSIFTLCASSLYDANEYIKLQSPDMKYKAKRFIYASIALVASSIIVYVCNGYEERIDFEKLMVFMQPYLSLLCASVAMFVGTCIPHPEVSEEKPRIVAENGVIRISEGTKEIASFEYKDVKKVKEVYIPNSVERIGEKAFYGCSVDNIYCEQSARPEGWSAEWDLGCCATVHWDYKKTVDAEDVSETEEV